MAMAPWIYHRPLTDSNATALANFPTRVSLDASNFDFSACKPDGSDIRIRDETAGALVPLWLSEFDAAAQKAVIWFKPVLTSNSHSLYCGNAAATPVSSFAGVFLHGSGFDTDFGDLTAAVAGAGSATRLPASTGPTDARYRRVYTRPSVPTVATTQWPNRTCVREFTILTDPLGNVVQDGGVYVAYYVAQATNDPTNFPGQTYRCTSPDLITWTNHTLALAAGAAGTFSDRGARVSTVLKFATGDYRMWFTANSSAAGLGGVGYATSTDGVTFAAVSNPLTNANCGITAIPPFLSGVPVVRKLASGSYVMFCEARRNDATAYPWSVFGWTSGDALTWGVMNSGGYVINGNGSGFASYGAANAHFLELVPGSLFALFAEGFQGSGTDITTFNGQVGWWTASSPAGPYTVDPGSPVAGRTNTFSGFGVEVSGLALLPGGAPILHQQDYTSADNSISNVYPMSPVTGRCGLFVATTDADAAFASVVLAAGNFTAENRCGITTHRDRASTNSYVMGLADNAGTLAADTSANLLPKFRTAIRRATHSCLTAPAPGDVSFLYWDPSGVINYFAASPTAPATWTLINNSFEVPPIQAGTISDFSNTAGTSWSSSVGAAGILRNAYIDGPTPPPDGSQCAFLYENGWCSQSVASVPAGTYTVTLRAKMSATGGANPIDPILIKVDGTTVDTITPTSLEWASFTSAPFTVAAGAHVLRLEGGAAVGSQAMVVFDLVSVAGTGTGSAGWGTDPAAVAGPSDVGREVLCRIDDDGTNFRYSVAYSDDGSPVASATIAKATVKPFTSGRVLFAGSDMFTTTNYAGAYSRRISVRPYAAVEPAVVAGAQVQDQATWYTLSAPSPSSGVVGQPSGPFTVFVNASFTGTITISPTGGGLTAPVTLTFNSGAPQTFTITPTAPGTITLTGSNSGGLPNPGSVSYVASAAAAPTTTWQCLAFTNAFPAGSAATIGYTVYSPAGAIIQARTTSGITRIGNGFFAMAALPWTGAVVVVFDDGTNSDSMPVFESYAEPGLTAMQALSLILAAVTGKTTGGGLSFYAPDGVTTRVAGTVTGNDRSGSTLTPPS